MMHGVIRYHAMHHQPIRYHDYDILHSHCDISVHYTICLLYLDQPASAKVPICTPPTQVVRVLCSSSLLNWWYSIRPNYLNNLDGYSKSHHPNKIKQNNNMTTTTKKLPIKMIDIVRSNTWTGLTVAELFHSGRLGSNGADKRNIELLAAQLYEPQDLEEYKELMKLANEAYEYLLSE